MTETEFERKGTRPKTRSDLEVQPKNGPKGTRPVLAKVMRAVTAAEFDNPYLTGQDWARVISEAAIAAHLKAIREPEDKILDVGYSAEPLPPMRASREHYRCAWQAMIDQLIADSEAGR